MTRIVIADDHAFLRAGLELVLGRRGFEVVASVGDGAAALAAIAEADPDLVIVDLRMPEPGGLAVLETLRARGDDRPLIILAAEIDDASLVAAVKAGANAIVLKHADPAQLQQAIDVVLAGGRHIAMDLMERAFSALAEPRPQTVLSALSERDRKIAEGAAAGLRNREIAERLSLSEGAVKINLHRIYDKLGIGNRTELALLIERASQD